MRLLLLLLILAPLAVFAQSETPTREHYQPIVDAKPFGDVAKQVSAEEAAKAAEEQKQKEEIAQKFRMVGITDYPDGTRKIAFLDETQGIASYLLGIGESENGFTLVEADYDAEWATLTKDGQRPPSRLSPPPRAASSRRPPPKAPRPNPPPSPAPSPPASVVARPPRSRPRPNVARPSPRTLPPRTPRLSKPKARPRLSAASKSSASSAVCPPPNPSP